MGSNAELQKMIRYYREETGETEFDMGAVADWLEKRGYQMPNAPTPKELLEKELRRAAREEHRHDSKGRPYRAYHAVPDMVNGQRRWVWFDIDDDIPRHRMEKSLTQRREQMVGDAMALVRDADRWNDLHPKDKPLQIELDFGPDVEWSKAAFEEPKAS